MLDTVEAATRQPISAPSPWDGVAPRVSKHTKLWPSAVPKPLEPSGSTNLPIFACAAVAGWRAAFHSAVKFRPSQSCQMETMMPPCVYSRASRASRSHRWSSLPRGLTRVYAGSINGRPASFPGRSKKYSKPCASARAWHLLACACSAPPLSDARDSSSSQNDGQICNAFRQWS